MLTCTISILCNAQCASTIEPCSCFEIAKLDIPRPAFHVSTDGDSFVPQFTLLLQFCPYFYLKYSEYKYEFYKSYFSAASRALTKAQAKGLATPFLSQNTGGWSFGTDGFVKKTNWNLWREERRTCDLPNDYLVEYAVKGRPRCQIHSDWFLSSKFQSTINDSQLSILWCLFPREQQWDIGQLQSVGQSGCSKKTN